MVALGSAAVRIAKVIHLKPSSDIIETLQKGSLFTDVLAEHWRQQLESYHIISFWEGIGDVSPFSALRLSRSPTFEPSRLYQSLKNHTTQRSWLWLEKMLRLTQKDRLCQRLVPLSGFPDTETILFD